MGPILAWRMSVCLYIYYVINAKAVCKFSFLITVASIKSFSNTGWAECDVLNSSSTQLTYPFSRSMGSLARIKGHVVFLFSLFVIPTTVRIVQRYDKI